MLAGTAFAYPCMLSQCHVNVLNALRNRHLTLAPNQCVAHLANPFTTVWKKHIRTTAFEKWPELMNGEWRIGKSEAKLMQIDRSHLYDLVKPNKAKSFAKREVNVAVPTKARLIQGNPNERTAYEFPDEYAVVNCILKSLAGQPFVWCGVTCRFVYAGGLNHDELSDIFTEAAHRPGWNLYDERDGKNWDATMNYSLLKAEAAVYDLLKLSSFERFLQRCSKVAGRVRTKANGRHVVVRYITAWKRLSGDWNTSAGNTIISMIIIFTVIKHMPEHLRPREWFALFMGDDYLAVLNYKAQISPRDFAAAMNYYEAKCGITPVRGVFTDPLRCSFISLGVWPRHDGGFQFVPNPGKQLAKLFWAADAKYRKAYKQYAHSIAVSFWPVFWGFPLMQKFLACHYDSRLTVMQLDKYRVEPLTKRHGVVNWREGFVYKYRLPYSALDIDMPYGGVWHHPIITEMILTESLDPPDRIGVLAS